MGDSIATYREASEANDIDRLVGVLAPDAEGRIRRIRPHLRPLLATMLFAALLGPRVVLRALRG